MKETMRGKKETLTALQMACYWVVQMAGHLVHQRVVRREHQKVMKVVRWVALTALWARKWALMTAVWMGQQLVGH